MLAGKKVKSDKKFVSKSRNYYQSKKYTNPFFQNTKKKRFSVTSGFNRIRMIIILSIITISALIWLFIYSKYFTISSTEIKGEGRIDPAVIEALVWEQINSSFFVFLPQKNIFVFNKKNLYNTLAEKFAFNNLIIEKKLPNKLVVRFSEKEYAIIWQEGERYYYGDNQGYVISELSNILDVNKKDYPLIVNQKTLLLENNIADIEPRYIEYIIKLFQEFKKNTDIPPLEHFIIDDDLNTVKIKLIDGPKLFFNINEDITKQIKKVLIIKNEKLKNDFFKKEYIDVRIGDSIYIR